MCTQVRRSWCQYDVVSIDVYWCKQNLGRTQIALMLTHYSSILSWSIKLITIHCLNEVKWTKMNNFIQSQSNPMIHAIQIFHTMQCKSTKTFSKHIKKTLMDFYWFSTSTTMTKCYFLLFTVMLKIRSILFFTADRDTRPAL